MALDDPLHLVGRTIANKYAIEKAVGEGGFAVVYRAQHTIWKKPVAIKFFNGLSAAPVDRREELHDAFINEGALLTELSSQTASIVQARDVGTYTTPDGMWMPFMVLEWLEGSSLEELLEMERAEGKPPWSLQEVCRLLESVASALNVAHQRGIAHRDVKPPNVFVLGDPHSADCTVKLLDFGVAKMMADNTHMQAALAKTGANVTSFTPQYGAPEQFSRGYGATGPWTDVFSLALMAVEMMTGRPALDGDDLVQLAFSASNPSERPSPQQLGVDVSDAVEAVFQKALATQTTERYANAGEFWTALKAAADTPYASTMVAPSSQLSAASSQLSAASSQLSAASSQLSAAAPQPAAAAPARTTNSATTSSPSTVTQPTAMPVRGGSRGLIAVGVVAAAAVAAGGLFVLRSNRHHHHHAARAAMRHERHARPAPPPAPAPAATCPKDMAKIPAGQFFMGSDRLDAPSNEKPPHNVKLDAFCMDLYEVTMKKYLACSNVGKCLPAPRQVDWPKITSHERKLYSPFCNANHPDRGNYPVNCVTWGMADTYCKAVGKRLPTEAEWEYATRGPDGREYPWGNDPPTAKRLNACGSECVKWGKKHGVHLKALYDANDGYVGTAPVGSFPAGRSRFGPYDVAGNVWEWTADWYGPYSAKNEVDPTGPQTGKKRVIRGGAFNGGDPDWLRPAYRYAAPPNIRSYGFGFRCAKSLPKP